LVEEFVHNTCQLLYQKHTDNALVMDALKASLSPQRSGRKCLCSSFISDISVSILEVTYECNRDGKAGSISFFARKS
jgi:hypothetical protein